MLDNGIKNLNFTAKNSFEIEINELGKSKISLKMSVYYLTIYYDYYSSSLP